MITIYSPPPLSEVKVFGAVTHGSQDKVYDDDEIKELINTKAGAYGRHWVYGDRNGRQSLDMDECNILVVYGPEDQDHIVFVGRDGLKDCLEFLSQFEAK
jgi:hypothetical protein